MDVESFISSLKSDPQYADQIVHLHTEAARQPEWADLPDCLGPRETQFLAGQGLSRLYSHQADAVAAASQGKDVLITTGPASGKSICYHLPLLQALLCDPKATALLLFPSKALARDQVQSWNRGLKAVTVPPGIPDARAMPFDGDTGSGDRSQARDSARVLVTNPEMLHMNLLPGHARWGRLLSGLQLVVLDEVHTYTGFFGANMTNVLRRLVRICQHYGARPQFICCSATIGNPREMAQILVGRELHHVHKDTSAGGRRTYMFWNPPRIKKRKWRGHRSANVEAHELLVKLVRSRVPTICFSKARNTAEMIYRYARESLLKEAPGLADQVIPYRGGYEPAERREMERRLRDGELLGVSATRALELGIDVGALDACIIVGYPGVLNAFFQQAGRAGRAGRDSLCILVGTGTLINQYVMKHPEFIFDRPIERAVLDCDNPFVVVGHMCCATAELPVKQPEVGKFGYAASLALDVLQEEQKVRLIEDQWYHSCSEQPAHEVRLRGYGDESTVVMDADTERIIDRLDKFKALRLFYPGAIYFHRGDTYSMESHDCVSNVVRVRRVEVSYYTDPLTGTAVNHIDQVLDQRPLGAGRAYLGEVYAVLSTPLYEKVGFYSMERISQHPTHLPEIAYEAMSFWLEPPPELPGEVAKMGMNAESGMRGILYCVSRILPLFLTSDTNDFDWSLGCRNTPWYTMFWFEFFRHGIGHAEQCYERLEEILPIALQHLLTCDCDDGCPNCTSRLITPYHVRNVELGEGLVHSRRCAVVMLNSLLSGQSASQSASLLENSQRKRGQQFLPAVVGEQRRSKPHRIYLSTHAKRRRVPQLQRLARKNRLSLNHLRNGMQIVRRGIREKRGGLCRSRR